MKTILRRKLANSQRRIQRRLDKNDLRGCSKPMMTASNIPYEIAGRTRVPAPIICLEFAMLALCLALAVIHATADRWPNAVVALLNGAVVAYAITRFLGIRETVDDLKRAWGVGMLGRFHPLLRWLHPTGLRPPLGSKDVGSENRPGFHRPRSVEDEPMGQIP